MLNTMIFFNIMICNTSITNLQLMQMHIIKKEDLTNHIFIDHTLIINEIERSIKFYNWDFILSSLPSGSFLVGGYIRDLILGRLNYVIDVDILVPKNAINVGKKIADKFEGKFIILDEARDVVRIIFKHISIDIASQISPSIDIDLLSRDFSINAIAFSFEEKLLIDPSNGIKDLQLAFLRTNSKQNLLDDPLRILRRLLILYMRLLSRTCYIYIGQAH